MSPTDCTKRWDEGNIPVRMRLNPSAVKTHVARMLSKLDLPDCRALAAWRPWQEGTERRGLFAPLLKPFARVERAAVILVIAVMLTVVLGRLDQEKHFELALGCVPRDDADQFIDVSVGWKVDLPISGPATVIWWESGAPPREWWEEHIIFDIPEGVVMADWGVDLIEGPPGTPHVMAGIRLEDGSRLALDSIGRVWERDTTSLAGAIALDHIQASIRTFCPEPARPPRRSGEHRDFHAIAFRLRSSTLGHRPSHRIGCRCHTSCCGHEGGGGVVVG